MKMSLTEDFVAHYVIYTHDLFLEDSIDSVYPYVDKILIARTLKPWNGEEVDLQETESVLEKIKEKYHDKVEIYTASFPDEHTQRNLLLNISRMRGHTGAFIIDCDEVITGNFFDNIYNYLANNDPLAIRLPYYTFVKNAAFAISPPFETGLFYVNLNNQHYFDKARNFTGNSVTISETEPEILHLSYIRENDTAIWNKINSFTHNKDADWEKWFHDCYSNFNPSLTNFHPVWKEMWSAVIPFNEQKFPEQLLKKLRSIGAYEPRSNYNEDTCTDYSTLNKKPIQCSIIIPVFNKYEYTSECLKTIFAEPPKVNFEIIVVDNASSDDTAENLAQLSNFIKVINNDLNNGFTIACNQGAECAEGKYLVFLNNDTIPNKGWLEELVAIAESDELVGAVGSKLIYPDGTLQESGGIIFSDAAGQNFGRGESPSSEIFNKQYEVDYCTGASLLIRKDLFDKLGGFDLRYAPAYYEETDLCFALRKLGYKVVYAPKSVITHFESVTANNSGFRRYIEINRKKFIEKWKDELLLQDNYLLPDEHGIISPDRKRLIDISKDYKYSYRKKYVNYNINEGVPLAYYPTFEKTLYLEAFYDKDSLFQLVNSYSFPWLYIRAYLEGRSYYIKQRNAGDNGAEYIQALPNRLKNDLNNIQELFDGLSKIQPALLKNLNDYETKPDILKAQILLTLGKDQFSGIDALKECYKLAVRYSILQGIIDEAAYCKEEDCVRQLEALLEKNYVSNKFFPDFQNKPSKVYSFPIKPQEQKKLKVLTFYPHTPYPTRTGADQATMGLLHALQELDCEIHLFSSSCFTYNRFWKESDIKEFGQKMEFSIYIHQAEEEDHFHIEMMKHLGGDKKWDEKIPPSLQIAFIEVYNKVMPDVLIINYAWWGKLIEGYHLPSVLKVLMMHDLLSLNSKMWLAAFSLMGDYPYKEHQHRKEALLEDIYGKLDICPEQEEYDIYNKYDYVISLSSKEIQGLLKHSPSTKPILIPVPLGCKSFAKNNTYSGNPVFAISDNVFNIQAFYFFVKRVLPIVREKIPHFKIYVTGDGCKILEPVPGVELLGYVDDLNKLYQESCFSIAPMLGGTGQSVKILEGMANGLPAVVMKTSYQVSAVQHGYNGFIAETAEEYAEYVIKLYNNRALCKLMGERGREKFYKEHSPDLIKQRIKVILDDSLAGKEPGKINKGVDYKPSFRSIINVDDLIDPYREKSEGKFQFINDSFFSDEVGNIKGNNMQTFFQNIEPAYIHFGGVGDACLLLSSFYDEEPEQVVISFGNSKEMMYQFFSNFPKLKKVYLFKCPTVNDLHHSLRYTIYLSGNCKGMGITPVYDFHLEWNKDLDIFSKYKIKANPNWAKSFKREKLEHFQVVIQPKGSAKGMVGSKRNMLTLAQWEELLAYFAQRDIHPVVIGTHDDESLYPIDQNCIDKRSFDFSQQMEIIASADLFIGADSWGKTFAALCGIPSIVYISQMGEDLKEWTDSGDYIFLIPWDNIFTVKKSFLEKLLEVNKILQVRNTKIIWEGSQFVYHSLALINREVCFSLLKKNFDMSVIPFEQDTFIPDIKYNEIKEKYNHVLIDADIHVRHHYPPNLKRPESGKWIIIQPWEYGSLPKEWAKVFAGQVDEIWVPGNYVKQVYLESGIPGEKVFVIPNGYNKDVFHPRAQQYVLKTKKQFKFLFVGGTIYRKGIDLILQSYIKAFKRSDDVCLVIKDIGGNSFYQGQSLKAKILEISSLGEVPEIEYIDSTLSEEEIAGLYTACNALVHPYRGEGFGLPIIEAMGSELPVIVTNGGAALDFCNETNSLLINAEKKYFETSSIDGMETVGLPWLYEPNCEHLMQLMLYSYNNPEEIKKLGRKGYLTARNKYAWEHIIPIYEERILELTSNSSRNL